MCYNGTDLESELAMHEIRSRSTVQSNMLHDFGGKGPILHLAHANGFPPGTYRLLAETLTKHYHVIGLPSRPLWPDTQPDSVTTWHPLASDLVRGLEDRGLSRIVGVGHSLGGVLTLWAALGHPHLFRAVVLIDPVILPSSWLWALQLMRSLGLRDRQPLVQGALHRRRLWPSSQSCFEHFRNKSLFARWSDASLRAYVESGTCRRADGQVELLYPPEWEAHIFATTPIHIWRELSRLRTQTLVVRGENSEMFRVAAQARMARCLPPAHFVTIPDSGHLVPMERPLSTGTLICKFLGDC
jgi:pimeloyl-ACP methyl ester carboxylesterase